MLGTTTRARSHNPFESVGQGHKQPPMSHNDTMRPQLVVMLAGLTSSCILLFSCDGRGNSHANSGGVRTGGTSSSRCANRFLPCLPRVSGQSTTGANLGARMCRWWCEDQGPGAVWCGCTRMNILYGVEELIEYCVHRKYIRSTCGRAATVLRAHVQNVP